MPCRNMSFTHLTNYIKPPNQIWVLYWVSFRRNAQVGTAGGCWTCQPCSQVAPNESHHERRARPLDKNNYIYMLQVWRQDWRGARLGQKERVLNSSDEGVRNVPKEVNWLLAWPMTQGDRTHTRKGRRAETLNRACYNVRRDLRDGGPCRHLCFDLQNLCICHLMWRKRLWNFFESPLKYLNKREYKLDYLGEAYQFTQVLKRNRVGQS